MNVAVFLTLALGCWLLGLKHANSQSCSTNQCGGLFNDTANSLGIALIANLHRTALNGQSCAKAVRRNVEMTEAVRWIFSKLNEYDYIPGVTLETIVLDACSREDVAIHELVSVFANLKEASCQQAVNGVIGIISSSQSKALEESLGKISVPLLSPTSSLSSLSNQTNYPTFFRTIPPATYEVKAIFDLVKELGIHYVAVVHSDDSYGKETADEFIAMARHFICIGGRFSVDDNVIMYKLRNMKEMDQILPVVYIGNYAGAEKLFSSANARDDSQHFLWIVGSSLDVQLEIFQRNTRIGRNVISVSPSSLDMQEFTQYWTEELGQFLQSNFTLPRQWYYRDYIYDLLGCSSLSACLQRGTQRIVQEYRQSAFLNMAVETSYIYAKALKDMHTQICNRQRGICPDLQRQLRSGGLVNAIKKLKFVYDQDVFPFMPSNLLSTTNRFNGSDPIFNGSDPMSDWKYTIQNTRCDERNNICNFIKVGHVTNREIVLDKSQVQFYLTSSPNEATSADILAPIFCKRNCEVCALNISQAVPFASIWGEYLIAGFFTATQPGTDAFGCSDEVLDIESVDLLETYLYAVDSFNGVYNETSEIFINGKPRLAGKLGIIVFNDCLNPLYAAQLLSNWLTGKIELRDDAGRLYDSKKCIAVIGGTFSSINLGVQPITIAENLLQASGSATSVQLDFNGSFLRTIPADDVQVNVMIDFVKQLGSNAISIVYRDDPYGIKGFEGLQRQAREAEICISVSVKIPENIEENDVHDVLDKLRLGRPTRIVILFTIWRQAHTILKVASTRASNKEFVWIGTESMGNRPVMLENDVFPEVFGSFSILVPTEPSPGFGRYLASLNPENNSRNPFFRPWWEKVHGCKLPSRVNPNPDNKCHAGLSLDSYQEDSFADLARKAVWSIGIGLSETVDKYCRSSPKFCGKVRTKEGLIELIKNVKKVEMTVFGEKRRLFTERGDGNVDEDVLNVQLVSGKPTFVEVAKFNRSRGFTITANYSFYDKAGNPVPVPYSTCTTCNCIYKHKDNPLIHLSKYIKSDGDMYIAAVLPIHSSTNKYEVSLEGLVTVEALIAAVNITSAKKRQKIGLIIFDGYGSPDLSNWHIVSLIDLGKYLGLEQYNVNQSRIVGLVTSNEKDLVSNKSLPSSRIVQFDLGESWTTANDDENYYFPLGYAIQSELSAIVSFLVHHKWENVKLLCSLSGDSQTACQITQDLLKEKSLCALEVYQIEGTSYRSSPENFLRQLEITRTKVVIALIEEDDVAPFVDAVGAENVRNSLPYPLFIGWSRFTKGVARLSGTYKDVCNNSVGFQERIPNLSPLGKQVLDTLTKLEEDPHRNPWFTNDVFKQKDLQAHYRVIEDTVYVAQTLVSALQELLDAECKDKPGLCDELLQKPDWRRRLFKNVDSQIMGNSQATTVFDILMYTTDNSASAPYKIKKIGEYDVRTKVTTLNSRDTLKSVTSACEGIHCDVCQREEKKSFPPWGIAFLIIVPILLGIIAAMGFFIYKERRNTNGDIYLNPKAVRPHVAPPPLPAREATAERNGPSVFRPPWAESAFQPGALDEAQTSASTFMSTSSQGSEHKISAGSGITNGSGPIETTLRNPSAAVRNRDGSYLNPTFSTEVPVRNPSTAAENRDGSFQNPAFTKSEPTSDKTYTMSLDVPSPASPHRITYGQLRFENANITDPGPGNTNQNNSSVHASGHVFSQNIPDHTFTGSYSKI